MSKKTNNKREANKTNKQKQNIILLRTTPFCLMVLGALH